MSKNHLCEICQIREAWAEVDGVQVCGPRWEEKQAAIAWGRYTEFMDVAGGETCLP